MRNKSGFKSCQKNQSITAATDCVECIEEQWMRIKEILNIRGIQFAKLDHTVHKLCRHLGNANNIHVKTISMLKPKQNVFRLDTLYNNKKRNT